MCLHSARLNWFLEVRSGIVGEEEEKKKTGNRIVVNL